MIENNDSKVECNEDIEDIEYRLEQQYGYNTHGPDYWAAYFDEVLSRK